MKYIPAKNSYLPMLFMLLKTSHTIMCGLWLKHNHKYVRLLASWNYVTHMYIHVLVICGNVVFIGYSYT